MPFVPIDEAAVILKCNRKKIVDLIVSNKLQWKPDSDSPTGKILVLIDESVEKIISGTPIQSGEHEELVLLPNGWVSEVEAAGLLGIQVQALRYLIGRGRLVARNHERQTIISRESIQTHLRTTSG